MSLRKLMGIGLTRMKNKKFTFLCLSGTVFLSFVISTASLLPQLLRDLVTYLEHSGEFAIITNILQTLCSSTPFDEKSSNASFKSFHSAVSEIVFYLCPNINVIQGVDISPPAMHDAIIQV